MSRQAVRDVVSWVFMVIATAAIVVGYVRLDNNQDAIKATARRSDAYTCAKFNELRGGMARVVKFSTKPADLTNLAPERVPIVIALNEQRAAFRGAALARLPARCRP